LLIIRGNNYGTRVTRSTTELILPQQDVGIEPTTSRSRCDVEFRTATLKKIVREFLRNTGVPKHDGFEPFLLLTRGLLYQLSYDVVFLTATDKKGLNCSLVGGCFYP
jgi:hypothetical protein